MSMSIGEMTTQVEDLYALVLAIFGLTELGIVGVVFAWGIVVSIFSFIATLVVTIVLYLLEAIPLFVLSRKAKRPSAWLVWVPFFPTYFRMYALCDIVGKKPLFLFSGKLVVENRALVFIAYLGILLFGNALVTVIMTFLNVIPGLGQIMSAMSTLLYLLPWVATAILEYVFLRDALDLFSTKRQNNMLAAIIITVLDNVGTFGFARTLYLYTMLGKKPLFIPIKEND